MNDDNTILNQLKILDKSTLNQSFTVPEHYFDDLPNKIQQKITAKQKSFFPQFSFAINPVLKPYFAIVTVFIFIAVTWLTVIKLVEKNQPQTELLADAGEEITIDDFDETQLVEMIVNEDSTETDATQPTDDEMLDYLNAENVDVSNIADEL